MDNQTYNDRAHAQFERDRNNQKTNLPDDEYANILEDMPANSDEEVEEDKKVVSEALDQAKNKLIK